MRLKALSCALIACVLIGSAHAQTWKSAASGNWSAPATWSPPPGATTTTPPAGATVGITATTAVTLDQDYLEAASLGQLIIDGQLSFGAPAAGATRTLAAERIYINGRFIVGAAPTARFLGNAEIILTGAGGSPQRELIVRPGGQLLMHGANIQNPWVQLTQSVAATATPPTLLVDRPVNDWPVGAQVVLASTDYDMNEAETSTVGSVAGAGLNLTITNGLANEHFGAMSATYGGRQVDMRGEVALLGRNIVVRGPTGAGTLGGHMMFMGTYDGLPPDATNTGPAPIVQLDGVEVRNMGQTGILGRYPIHFHFSGSVGSSYVRRCSIHDSHFRAISVHGTHDLRVEDNVAYDIVGHAYYLENGSETGNEFSRNLGLVTKATMSILRPDFFNPTGPWVSTEDDKPGTFWITNPDNTFEDNHAAGSDEAGFWFAYHDPGVFGGAGATVSDPLILNQITFDGNSSHSNAKYGVFDENFGWKGDGTLASGHWSDTTVYKNGEHGFWVRGFGALRVPGLRAADNPSAVYFASTAFFGNEQTTFVMDGALIIGESANTGDPTLGSVRSVAPNPPNADLIGIEIYDGLMRVEDCDFANFNSTAARRAGAIGPNYTDQAATVDPRTALANLRFHPSSAPTSCNPLWMRTSPFGTWPTGNGNRSLIVEALTTSSAWNAGETIVAANGESNPSLAFLAHGTGASYNADWNAHVIPSTWVSAPLASVATTGTHGQLMFGYASGPAPSSFTLTDFPSGVSRQVGAINTIFFPINAQAGRIYDVADGITSRSGATLITWGFGAPYSFTVLRIPITNAPAAVSMHWAQPSSDNAGLGTPALQTTLTSYTDVSTSAALAAWASNDLDLVGHDMTNNLLYLKLIMLDGADPNWFTHPLTVPNMPSYISLYPTETNLHGFGHVMTIIW